MHPYLKQQLQRLGFDCKKVAADQETCEKLLEAVSRTYVENDEKIHTMERSLEKSAKETEALYDQLKTTTQCRFDAIVGAIPDLIFLNDFEGTYLDVFADGKEEKLFVPKEEIVGRNIREIFPYELATKFLSAIKSAILDRELKIIEYDLDFTTEVRSFEARVMPTRMVENTHETAIVIVRDITKKKASENSARLISTVFEEATEGIMIEDGSRHVISVNPSMLKMIGMHQEDIIGKHSTFFAPLIGEDTAAIIDEKMRRDGFWHGEVSVKREGRDELPVWLTIDAVFDDKRNAVNFVVMMTDISEIKRTREKLEHIATHDALTMLPNRVLLYDRLNVTLERSKRSDTLAAVLFVDIDHFKDINDNLGHIWGDELLVQCAERLRTLIRAEDTLGRLGGDEFLIIVNDLESKDDVTFILQKIMSRFEEPFVLEEREFDVTVSVGVSLYPDDGKSAEELIKTADMAMYKAKKSGRNNFWFYSSVLSEHSKEYFQIDRALKTALKNDEFYLLYQPQISLENGRVTGVEALLRCRNPRLENMSTAKYIAVAENSATIIGIGKWVLKEVCRQIMEWQRETSLPFVVAINLSRRQLSDKLLVDYVQEVVKSCDIDVAQLEFEITESTLMQNSQIAQKNIETLRALGYKFSIDDFGTGYSSLANLKQFSLDKLKIDRSFICGLESDENDRVIVKTTIALGKNLGLKVIAEGVETAEQELFLKENSCDEVQGYLNSPPVTATEFAEIAKAKNGLMGVRG
jgi:diguanylate cyclase (GGDEF)-like protein/PAS domain S-box-containing protein